MAIELAREKTVSEKKRQTKLYQRDDKYVSDRMVSENKTESEIIRELVSTGKRTQVLRNRGHDVTTKAVRHAQKEVVREMLAPLISQLNDQDELIRKLSTQTANDYASIEGNMRTLATTSNTLLEGFTRILQNIIVIRALIWHYVTVFFHQVMDASGKKIPTSQLNAIYNREVVRAKIEAVKKQVVLDDKQIEQAAAEFGSYLVAETSNPTIPPEKERKPL